ncbi:TatD family hydrolase [Candidatus Woesearchaeota archaeon]|nr:TatD family hydrolase [Candidatus Woesearchaeota archaeon]
MDFPVFADDLDVVLCDCGEEGVTVIVANGVNPESNRKTVALAKKYSLIKPALGYYPTHVWEDGLEAVRKELFWIERQRPVALGEIGLDYKECETESQKEMQRIIFKEFIALGKRLRVPLIIHSRKAEADVLAILEEEEAEKVILHCFMGKKKLVERARDLGYSFSIPVSVTKLDQLQWLVRHVPLRQLLTETDAPYLGPVRGERNTPANVRRSVERIASLVEMTVEDVANQLFMNYQRLF